MAGDFIDTTIVIYLLGSDVNKANRAEEVVTRGGSISVQVLNEAANVCRRKLRLSYEEINEFLGDLRKLLRVHPVTLAVHDHGMALAARHMLSVYDSMIVAAAVEAGCDRLWSEDMQHGMIFADCIQVINPFLDDRV